MAATPNAAPAPGTATAEDLPNRHPPLPVPKACEALRHEVAAAAHSQTARPLAPLVPLRFGGESQVTAAIWTGTVMG